MLDMITIMCEMTFTIKYQKKLMVKVMGPILL
jgi:hypothetical protein